MCLFNLFKKKNRIENFDKIIKISTKNHLPFINSLPLDKPVEFIIEIGNKCNLNCLSCDTHKNTRPKDEINLQLFEKVVNIAKENNYKTIKLHLNNEPIFNKNIIEIFKIINKNNIKVILTTNGMLIENFLIKYLEANLDLSLIEYKYSIDGGTKETFEKLRRGASFEKLISSLEFLQKLYKSKDLPLVLKMNYNLSEINLKEIGIFYDVFSKFFGEDYTSDNYFFRLLDGRGIGNSINPLFEHIHENLNYKTFNSPCWIPFAVMPILFNGDISSCCLDYNGEMILGNINENNFLDCWNSLELKNFREAHLHKNLQAFPKCQNCYRPKWFMTVVVDKFVKNNLLPNYIQNKKIFQKNPELFIEKLNKFIEHVQKYTKDNSILV